MNKLTIILPSLNVANYIHTSINSVISQTLDNMCRFWFNGWYIRDIKRIRKKRQQNKSHCI